MKKGILAVFLAVVMVIALTDLASAGRAGTAKKGSLLIFPKVDVSDMRDTIIMITNDHWADVFVKCYWVDAEQELEDMHFKITGNQPVWFNAKDGLGTRNVQPFMFGAPVGELKCWATDAAGSTQIRWNHLYGQAKILDFRHGTAWEYNSWNFAAKGVGHGKPVGVPGTLALAGKGKNNSISTGDGSVPYEGGYDNCPSYLMLTFAAATTKQPVTTNDGTNLIEKPDGTLIFKDTDLTVVPCYQDLRQDRKPTYTKLKFDIWNEDEVKYTGAYKCIKCWFEGWLGDISEKFLYENLHTHMGRLRVRAIPSTVCPDPGIRTGLVGVASQWMKLESDFIRDKCPECGLAELAVAGTNLVGAGNIRTDLILWDTQDKNVPEKQSK